MDQAHWDRLLIERRSAPAPVTDDHFRAWMAANPIFISSTMDDEMTPAREAARTLIRRWDGHPIMWEELAPQDLRPEDAYLEGVDQSHLFALLLGHRYGRGDATGYSPTHKEANRAAERHIPRLLFQPAALHNTERDGRLSDWVATLHNQLSGGSYRDAEDLARLLEQRLREIASTQETPWIKLGRITFPGKIRQRTISGETRFIVTTTVRDRPVRDALASLSDRHQQADAGRLTWGVASLPIVVEEVEIDSQTLSADDVVVTCRRDPRRTDGGAMGTGGINYVEQGRTIGPVEQVPMWADQALFGAPRSTGYGMGFEHLIAPTGPTLPEILVREQARGWLADGLVRLYVIEGLITKFGGQFTHLQVGPATATGIRVDAGFRPTGYDQAVATLSGIVALPS